MNLWIHVSMAYSYVCIYVHTYIQNSYICTYVKVIEYCMKQKREKLITKASWLFDTAKHSVPLLERAYEHTYTYMNYMKPTCLSVCPYVHDMKIYKSS